MKLLLLLQSLICCVSTAWSANILGIFIIPSYSHYSLGQRLLEELANKGHDVTMIAAFKENRKIDNYKEIYIEEMQAYLGGVSTIYLNMESMQPIEQSIIFYNYSAIFTNITLRYQPLLDLIHSNKTFHVVVMDHFLNDAILAIPYKLKAPVVIICSTVLSLSINHFISNPAPLSQIPNTFVHYHGKMNFFQRINNLFQYMFESIYRILIVNPLHERIAQEAFPGLPDLNTLIYSRSPFVLVNTHISINNPMPHVPNMVEIGGFHVKNQELPLDLKEYLDNSKEGVIYFGMGSNFQFSELPIDKLGAILKALSKLKQNVLLKWEEGSMPGQPANIETRKWLPQQAILAHPNTEAFISHGGLLSIIEAVHYGVPILGIPLFADQKLNINQAINKGYAVSVPFSELSEEKLTKALNQILNNNTYRQNVQARSMLMKERPVPPLQEAIFWVEHVIKFNGSEHFRNLGMDLKWYEYIMLDVAIFLIVILIAICFSIYLVIRHRDCIRRKQKMH